MIEIKQDSVYILIGNLASNRTDVFKAKIVEYTEQTILYQNLDSESQYKVRETKKVFEYKYSAIEEIK